MSKKALLKYKKPTKYGTQYYGERKVIIPNYLIKILKEKPKTGKSILELVKLKPVAGDNAKLIEWNYLK